jgi:hypothetical protein
MTANRNITCLILLACLYSTGCGRGPKLANVRGRVLYADGRPVTAASVCFIPDAERANTGLLATGLLETDGTFRLRTYPQGEGVGIGIYKVTVSLGRGTPRKLAKYTRANETPFEVEVPSEGIDNLELILR